MIHRISERAAITTSSPHVPADAASDVLDRCWRSRSGVDEASDRAALARCFADDALGCVSAALEREPAILALLSADLLSSLISLWAAAGLDPVEIWTELHKREQLGSLLMQLNQAQSRAPRRLLKPWKVDSTKLP